MGLVGIQPVANAQTADLAPLRDLEPVVIPGASFVGWVRVPGYVGGRLNLYRFQNGEFDEIPFQVDKRRKTDLRFNVPDSPSGGAIETPQSIGLRQCSRICEWSYFPMKVTPMGITDPFLDEAIYPQDEIVFMAADAGEERAGPTDWIPDDRVGSDRYEIEIKDRNGTVRYVYAFMWLTTPPDLSPVNYVSYVADQPGEVLTCPPDIEACGTATALPSGRLSDYDGFVAHWGGNWILDRLELGGGVPDKDLIDAWRLSISNGDEGVFSSVGWPRFLGIKTGPVRIVRGVQGARSGIATTRYDLVYPTRLDTVINLRVHDLGNFLRLAADHDDGLLGKSWVHLNSAYASSLSDEIDAGNPTETDVPGAFTAWSETKSTERASLYVRLSEPRENQSTARVYNYLDSSALPGSYRNWWADVGWTQDGGNFNWDTNNPACMPAPSVPAWDPSPVCCKIASFPGAPDSNDGGCPATSDPSDDSYYWTQQALTYVPLATDGPIDEPTTLRLSPLATNVRQPLLLTFERTIKDGPPAPPPPFPCIPVLQAISTGTGDVDLSLTGPCAQTVGLGMAVYRAEGSEALAQIADLGASRTFRDANVRHGVTYRYAVRSYAHGGAVGSLSPEHPVTVTDTTPPYPPGNVVITAQGLQATATWEANPDGDTLGFNAYIATSPGGPYQKVTGTLRPIYQPWEVTVVASAPGTYYVTVTAVDFAGNESAMSAEESVYLGAP